jgi:hypothetical protein
MKDLLENLSRYPRFLLGLSLGIFLAFLNNFAPLFKNPITATAVIGMFVGILAFMFFTLRAMLGLDAV